MLLCSEARQRKERQEKSHIRESKSLESDLDLDLDLHKSHIRESKSVTRASMSPERSRSPARRLTSNVEGERPDKLPLSPAAITGSSRDRIIEDLRAAEVHQVDHELP